MMRQIGDRLGPYSVSPDELHRLREHVRSGRMQALASVYPGAGNDSLIRFHAGQDADRALELLR